MSWINQTSSPPLMELRKGCLSASPLSPGWVRLSMMFQSLNHLCGLLLDFSSISVSFCAKAPKLDTALQLWPMLSRSEGALLLTGNALPIMSWDSVGLFYQKEAILAHCQVVVEQESKVFLSRAAFQPFTLSLLHQEWHRNRWEAVL